MKILLVYCHPVATSFAAALRDRILAALEAKGHQVELVDLYAEGFDPALSTMERIEYEEPPENREQVLGYAAQVKRCEGLLLVHPTWWYGMPAMLKGWFDRVWIPGVAFDIDPSGGISAAELGRIRKLAVVTTYGAPEWFNRFVMGDPARKVMARGLKRLLARGCGFSWNACYDMDRAGPDKLERFARRTVQRLERFFAS